MSRLRHRTAQQGALVGSIDIAVRGSRKLEALLEQRFGAFGRGLHEKVQSVEGQLPFELTKVLRRIATQRNRVVHEDGAELDVPRFEAEVAWAEEALGALGPSGANPGPARFGGFAAPPSPAAMARDQLAQLELDHHLAEEAVESDRETSKVVAISVLLGVFCLGALFVAPRVLPGALLIGSIVIGAAWYGEQHRREDKARRTQYLESRVEILSQHPGSRAIGQVHDVQQPPQGPTSWP